MWTVYILKSEKQDKYYIGHTGNLERRLIDHNSGKTKSLRPYIPVKIIYTESYEAKKDAYRREMKIKSYKGGIAFKNLLNL